MEQKKAQKESAKLIEEMIWGAPRGGNTEPRCFLSRLQQLTGFVVEAPVLVDFWQENFRVQVQARLGRLHLVTEGEYLGAPLRAVQYVTTAGP